MASQIMTKKYNNYLYYLINMKIINNIFNLRYVVDLFENLY